MEYIFFAGGLLYFGIFLLGFLLIPILYILTMVVTVTACTIKEIRKK
jgi:hypothetical protein